MRAAGRLGMTTPTKGPADLLRDHCEAAGWVTDKGQRRQVVVLSKLSANELRALLAEVQREA